MSSHYDRLSRYPSTNLDVVIKCSVLSKGAADTTVIVFVMTRPGLEPRIDCTLGHHAHHYATDAVYLANKKPKT